MKVVKKGYTCNNEQMQIEEWSEDYSFMSYGSTLAIYPKSKQTINSPFAPKLGDTFRLQLDFNSHDEALKAFHKLQNGKSKLKDYKSNIAGRIELFKCI